MRLDKSVDKIFEKISKISGKSPDLTTRKIKVGFKNIGYLYLESVASDDKISDFLMQSISLNQKLNRNNFLDNFFNNLHTELKNNIYHSKMQTIDNYDDMFFYLTSGYVVVIVDGFKEAIVFEAKETLDRGVTVPTTEVTIKGPKDSFTESHAKNIGLIRKRIKDPKLWFKELSIGTRSKTKVSIAYINDIADMDKVNQIYEKLKGINIDAILDSGYIRDFLANDSRTHFPTVISTERPDLVSASLLEGRIAILVENTPFVLVIPGLMMDFMHAPEDNYQKAINISFTRLIRFIGMLVTILTPALYVAITNFNQQIIPDDLLISLAVQSSGVPFSTSIALLILLITFEILRESDMRLPEAMGTSISIVGALVLGDAAVNAHIVSPIVVIVVAITEITALLFSDLDVVNAFRWWRIVFLAFASMAGLIGFVVAGLIFIVKISSIEVMGIPYLTPFSPLDLTSLKDTILTLPRNKMNQRPNFLAHNNQKRMRDNNEN